MPADQTATDIGRHAAYEPPTQPDLHREIAVRLAAAGPGVEQDIDKLAAELRDDEEFQPLFAFGRQLLAELAAAQAHIGELVTDEDGRLEVALTLARAGERERVAEELAEVTEERDSARSIVEDLLALLRSVRADGVVPRPIWDEIAEWLGPVEPIADDGSATNG